MFIASFISFSQCSITETKIERMIEVIDDETYGDTFQFMSLKNFCSKYRSSVKLQYQGLCGVFLEMMNVKDSFTP